MSGLHVEADQVYVDGAPVAIDLGGTLVVVDDDGLVYRLGAVEVDALDDKERRALGFFRAIVDDLDVDVDPDDGDD